MKKKKRTWNKCTATVMISINSLMIFAWVFALYGSYKLLIHLLEFKEMTPLLAFAGAILCGFLFWALVIFMPSFIIDNVIGANKALEDYRKWG